MVYLEDDWIGEDAGYTPTLPSAWLKRRDGEDISRLEGVMVHSGWWAGGGDGAQRMVG
jgi:hypothetical protein